MADHARAGHTPFDPDGHDDNVTIRGRVLSGAWSFTHRPERWAHVSEAAKEVIRGLLSRQPADRPTATRLLAQDWVGGAVAPAAPLPGSENALRTFNEARRVWRAAVNATQLIAMSPSSAMRAAARRRRERSGFGSGDAAASPAGESPLPDSPLRWELP